MAVATLPQGIIPPPGSGVVLDGDARPVMDGGLQPLVAGKTTDHEALLAAAPRHRSNPCQGAQGVIISGLQRLRCLGEQCGKNNPADSRPGAKDCHVTLLTALPRRTLFVLRFEPDAEAIQGAMGLLDLLIDQAHARRKTADMRAGGFRRAWCDEQGRFAQGLQCRGSIEATDAIVLEDARDRLL